MSNIQPIENYFRAQADEREIRAREQAYALERRRMFEAGVDSYFAELKKDLAAGIGALRSRAANITTNESMESWQAIYGDFDVEVRLDKRHAKIVASYGTEWRGTAPTRSTVRYELVCHGTEWEMLAETNRRTVANPIELLTPFLALAFPT